MYRDEILDLYKHPRNQGTLENGLSSEGKNPSCGDEVEVFIELDEENNIEDIKHQTDACAIATAGVSIVTEEVKQMSAEEVMELDRDWMIEKMGVEVSPMRIKCAVIGLKTVQSALSKTDF